MLNYIWGGMVLIGIIVAAFNGTMGDVSNAAINSAKEAVTLAITMLGVVSMWTGLMKIAERSGIITYLSKKMTPFLTYLFPDIPKGNKSLSHIATNMIANVLGLGWAATPAGLMAMDELQKINKKKDRASKSMCMFMIVNMSSLQLISINIITFRSQYGSANPAEIIAPGILATLVSTVVGIAFVKVAEVFSKE